jgi:NAD kinase
MGSLGFLCPFDFENYKEYIDGVIKGNVPILLRHRLRCTLEKLSDYQKLDELKLHHNNLDEDLTDDKNLKEWLSLNEVVIGRGSSPYLSNLDLYVNDYLITTVQGDGLIISTPTGSTAYAMAAGASMCHPSVSAIVIAPICPHSLSFRPIVVPAGVRLRISLSIESRNTAWYSVDGRFTNELKHGQQISVTMSEHPLPSICRSNQINDWFDGLANCLHWNQRQKQLPLNECYMGIPSHIHSSFSFSSKSSSPTSINFSNFSFNQNNLKHQSNLKEQNRNYKYSQSTESTEEKIKKDSELIFASSSRSSSIQEEDINDIKESIERIGFLN